MKTMLSQLPVLLPVRSVVASLVATAMLFAFTTNAFALWPAGIYYFSAISGTVIDKETRKPIEGVVVVGHWGLETKQIMSSSYSGPLVVKEVVTDKDGKFTIPASVATDIFKRGHYNAERYPEIGFFKSGYEFTRYRHSGIDPITGDPVTYNTAKGDEYVMPKLPADRNAQVEKYHNALFPFQLIETPGICPDYETTLPHLLLALRKERDRVAKIDLELSRLFAYAFSLKTMEICIANRKRSGE